MSKNEEARDHLATRRQPGDPGYDTLTHAQWVLEDDAGGWEADLTDLSGAEVGQVEAAVAAALGVPAEHVRATPTGANVSGDTSHRNAYVTADEWALTVRG